MANVFFITAGMFGGMALYGTVTRKDLTGVGSFVGMGLWGLILVGLVNMFMHSEALSLGLSVVTVFVFSGLTAYDTQRIRALAYQSTLGGSARLTARRRRDLRGLDAVSELHQPLPGPAQSSSAAAAIGNGKNRLPGPPLLAYTGRTTHRGGLMTSATANGFCFFRSTIGKKMLVGLSGLGLAGFVLMHMAGNLLLFAGPEAYNKYSHKLTSTPLIYVAEAGLVFFFVMHIMLTIQLTLANRAARRSVTAPAPRRRSARGSSPRRSSCRGFSS